MEGRLEGNEIESAIALLRERMEFLVNAAQSLGKRHGDLVDATNPNKTWEEKSILQVRARIHQNSLGIEWYEVRWYGSSAAKTRRPKYTYLGKPKDKYIYSMGKLLKNAQSWEAAIVEEIETGMSAIRREATFIGKAIGQLNHITRGVAKE